MISSTWYLDVVQIVSSSVTISSNQGLKTTYIVYRRYIPVIPSHDLVRFLALFATA